ncbi:MAG: aspartate ammonia-lyase [Candidatus Micrarchaeota archaeon]|nr:aspartate ammonia-lyase [Candidatus Micrarchaeota archaeon]
MRIESDSLGKVSIPSGAYYGPVTQRAVENFPISGVQFHHGFIRAYAMIKRSAAVANVRLGGLDPKISKAIVKACDEIIAGKLADQFPVDVFQAGTGTSTNMNLNEVVANRALEIMHKRRGDYKTINPNDHVNMCQSTNDTFQCAINIAAHIAIEERLVPALAEYERAMARKAREFSRIVKTGRTHLMDAVPVTLGQEFSGYSVEREMRLIRAASDELLKLHIGGTAVGTGLNSYPKYPPLFLKELKNVSGHSFKKARNNFEMTQNLPAIAETSSALRQLSIKLIKTMNDLRLMSSGPHTGIGEIILPAVQPGSSIMPGKVNPSMPEALTMVCFRAIGNDSTILMCAQGGQFELNIFGPIAAHCLLESIETLSNSLVVVTKRCITGIKPNRKRLEYYFEHNSEIATALSPLLGYSKTAKLVKEAERNGMSIRELVIREKLLSKKELDEALSQSRLTKPDLPIER